MPPDLGKHLIQHLTETFLPELKGGGTSVSTALERAHCPLPDSSSPIVLHIKLSALFDALWTSAESHGSKLPAGDWDNEFKRFVGNLMNPWPINEIAAAGFSVRLRHKSNSMAEQVYTFASI